MTAILSEEELERIAAFWKAADESAGGVTRDDAGNFRSPPAIEEFERFVWRQRPIPRLLDHISALTAANREMREALEPFADVAEWDIGGDEVDEDTFRPITEERHRRANTLTVGHFRRAARALSARPESKGEEG